jgi:hypothetical protein
LVRNFKELYNKAVVPSQFYNIWLETTSNTKANIPQHTTNRINK